MKLNFVNYNDIFDPDKVIGSANLLDPSLKDDNGKKKFDDNGIFSERIFGLSDDKNTVEIIGWIDFGDYYIINPLAFSRIKKVIRKDLILKMISFTKKTDKDGNIIEEEDNTGRKDIGLIKFREEFLDILEQFGKKDKPEYKILLRMYDEETLFINKFPVFSSRIRPAIVVNKTLIYDDINKYYNLLIKYNNEIHELVDECDTEEKLDQISCLQMMYQLQFYANLIVDNIIDSFLKGKKGVFRKHCIGVRLNFSCRNVITPKIDGKINELDIPYVSFLEIYKFLLINIICKTEGITTNQALLYVESCKTHFDKKLYSYMMEIKNKSKYGLKVLLNRNPTINIGSILCMGIDKIKDDYNDLTLSIPNKILGPLAADYDGDVLNMLPLITTRSKLAFKKFDPNELLISYNDGDFNTEFMFDKDQKLGLWNLTN